MTQQPGAPRRDDDATDGLPDHELEVLEDDETVPPRPEELIADAGRGED